MKLNGKNIIFDDDITMTGKYLGEKLSDIVGELQSKTSKMESYLKWIYNYGGVGGVGGSGGGGNGSSEYILYTTLNGIQLNGQIISLGKEGHYPLKISVQRPNGATFSARYSIVDSSGQHETFDSGTIPLNISNNYEYSVDLNLNYNAVLVITVTDSIYNIKKQSEATYIIKSYEIDTKFINSGGIELGDEIMVGDLKTNGIFTELSYNIAVPYKELVYELSIDLGKEKILVDKNHNSDYYIKVKEDEKNRGSIKLDILKISKELANWEPTNENAGYYTISLSVEILIDGQISSPKLYEFKYNLIPPELYLLVSPTFGNIYRKESNDPYIYDPGYILFNIKPYFGSELDSACTISYYSDDNKEKISQITTYLRKTETIKVYATRGGLNKLNLRLSCNEVHYPGKNTYITYYFYINDENNGLTWYNFDSVPRKGIFNYYRGGTETTGDPSSPGEWLNKNLDNFRLNVMKGGPLTQSINGNPVCINIIKENLTWKFTDDNEIQIPNSDNTTFNTVIHLGLQYSDVNPKDTPILTGYTRSDKLAEPNFILYQDRIELFRDKVIKCYIPKSKDEFNSSTDSSNNYHLISFVYRYLYTKSMLPYYEATVYIDGILEGVLTNYSNEILKIEALVIEPSNIKLDLLDVSYPDYMFKDNPVYGEPPISLPEDPAVFKYYLNYKSSRGLDNMTVSNYKNILEISSKIDINNNGDVTCTEATANNIAKKSEIPVILFEIQDNKGNIKKEIDRYYKDNEDTNTIPANVHWSKPNSDEGLVNVLKYIPGEFSNASFSIQVQGSSTKNYKCKNFTLAFDNLDQSETAPVYLFSPNFSTSDKKTFLPERKFTLKADVVDSSHSNNTSIGKFINDITKPFDTKRDNDVVENPFLKKYIKNCLDGFPILVFIEYVKHVEGKEPEKICYYQGVYNFNLGRDSYFNLGYSDINVFCDEYGKSMLTDSKEGFLFYKIPNGSDKLKDGLVVAEIQGNNTRFDFSQYDQSILFPLDKNDPLYMFGDIVSSYEETDVRLILSDLVKNIAKAGGYIFGPNLLKKTFSDSESDEYGYKDGYSAVRDVDSGEKDKEGRPIYIKKPANQVPNFKKQLIKYRDDFGSFKYRIKETLKEPQDIDLENLIINKYEIQNDKRVKILPWIDFDSLSEYYTICMAFGLVDSVQKNMNLKSWNADNLKLRGRFYTAFYDMDTSLGLNNAGGDVSYFAFSDYWDYSEEKISETIKPTPIVIYRDYSPRINKEDDNSTTITTKDFYDTASSYLFAVAKYARKVYNDVDDSCTRNEVINWPKELWAAWRRKSKDNKDVTIGCLSSAKEFMNNYFSNTLKDVCPLLVSMNYRNKYLVKLGKGLSSDEKEDNEYSFDNLNVSKFNGTRYYKVEDWLNSRFHILDAYFNLPNATNLFQYYDESGNYVKIPGDIDEPSIVQDSDLINNKDIIIFDDIFSGDQDNQSSGNLNFNVRAHEFSPLFITTANTPTTRFLLGGDNNYNIITNLAGTQMYKFGGSGAWTYLDSINSFGFSNLTVDSRYLETLSGTSSFPMTVTSNNINLPSLRDLILNGSNYTGNIDIDGDNLEKPYTNLRYIDVSNSSISLSLNKSSCNVINISNKKKSSVDILNCNNITNINFGKGSPSKPSTVLSSCKINPIPEYLAKNGLYLDYTNIDIITLNNTINSNSSKISIKNDSAITKIQLTGFKEVVIENCPYLSELVITNSINEGYGDKLEKLYIRNCGNLSKTFRIGKGSEDDLVNQADLEHLTNLNTVSIRNCSKLTRIKFSKKDQKGSTRLKLLPEAFFQDTELKYISGDFLTITGTSTFQNCYKFTLDQGPEEEYPDPSTRRLLLLNESTNLSSTFACSGTGGSIGLTNAREFLLKTKDLSIVTAISSLFGGQNIRYDKDLLINDLRNGSRNYLDFTVFPNVSNADNVLGWAGISAWHPKMMQFGKNVSSISMTNYSIGSNQIYTTIDIFKDIIDKIENYIGWNNSYDYYSIFTFLDSRGNTINTVKLKDFFHPNGKHPKKVKTLSKIGVNNPYVDLEGIFYNWSSLTYINRCFFDKTYNSGNNTKLINLEGLLKYKICPLKGNRLNYSRDNEIPANEMNISTIRESFSVSDISSTINLFEFCRWDKLFPKGRNGGDPFPNRTDTEYNHRRGAFYLPKFIIKSDFDKLINIIRSSSNSGISNIFNNCTLISGGEPKLDIGDGGIKFKNITRLSNTFNNFKFKYTIEDIDNDINIARNIAISSSYKYTPFYIDKNFFKNFPIVKECQFTFANTNITSMDSKTNAISLNFFHTRYESTTNCYYINPSTLSELSPDKYGHYVYKKISSRGTEFSDEKVSNSFKESKYHIYSYSRRLTDIRGMFENVSWDKSLDSFGKLKNARSYIYNDEEINEITPNHIEVLETHEKLYDSTIYYAIGTRNYTIIEPDPNPEAEEGSVVEIPATEYYFYKKGKTDLNTELTDIKEVRDSEKPLGGYSRNWFKNGKNLTNFDMDNEVTNKLFIAPDFFYSCLNKNNDLCNINCVFNNDINIGSCLEGLIPTNLFKFTKENNFINTFKNLNIIPRYLRTDKLGENEIRNIYVYIPYNFTLNTSLSNCFNFHLNVPASAITKIITNSEGKTINQKIYDAYYLFKQDSISKGVTTLSNSLPSVDSGRLTYDENSWPNFYTEDYEIYYNLMYTERFRTVDGELINEPGEVGLHVSKMNQFKFDNLINSKLILFLHGHIFDSSFKLDNIIWENRNNYIIDIPNYGNNYSMISRNCVFPAPNNNNSNYIGRNILYFSSTDLHINSNQIEGSIKDPYETIQVGGSSSRRVIIDN